MSCGVRFNSAARCVLHKRMSRTSSILSFVVHGKIWIFFFFTCRVRDTLCEFLRDFRKVSTVYRKKKIVSKSMLIYWIGLYYFPTILSCAETRQFLGISPSKDRL